MTTLELKNLAAEIIEDLKELPNQIDKLKLCSHEYDEDIGNFVRRYLGIEEKP